MESFSIGPREIASLWLSFAALTIGGAAVLRRAQRLPFFRPKFPDAAIQQSWRSGRSSVGLLGRLARADNCLWFTLTRDTLHVGAHFPFNMFMPRFIAGLDLTIPVVAISSVSEETASWGGGYVRVAYEVTDKTRGFVRTEHVDLWPKRGDHFFNILHDKVRGARQRRTF
jgi:hypothetical protein